MTSRPERILFVTRRPLLALRFRELLAGAGWPVEPQVIRPDSLPQSLESQDAGLVAIDSESGVPWETLAGLRSATPGVRLVVWCQDATPEMVQHAMAAGLDGLLSMRLPAKESSDALLRIWRGERQFRFHGELHPRTAEPSLTRREQQVISLVMQGLRNREIAATLHTTEGSIKVYVNRIFTKTGVKSRQELALVARGIVRPSAALQFDAVWMFSSSGEPHFQPQGEV
ncbi:MAG: response regulator transcription factor [Acidobacteriia bacterium]|nr:response regulator transcription factor [Terriglobia bacterium]